MHGVSEKCGHAVAPRIGKAASVAPANVDLHQSAASCVKSGGEDDEVAPVSDLQRLLVAGRGRDVTALTLPGVGHDLSVVLTEAVLPGLLGFLDSLGKARPAQRLV